jgi:hypothetical protein
MLFQPAGIVGASPTPSSRRLTSSSPRPPAAAEAKEATVHRNAAARLTQVTPILSMMEPTGSWSIAYVHRNAEASRPIWEALMSKSRMIAGAAMDRLTLSM